MRTPKGALVLLSPVDLAAFEALCANVNALGSAVILYDLYLLHVYSPTFPVLTVGVAHFITAELSFIAYTAYPRHTFTSVYVADIYYHLFRDKATNLTHFYTENFYKLRI